MLKKKLTAFLTSIVLLSAVFVTPALADTDLRISDNGSHSDNSIRVNEERNVTVRQTNDTNITNNVSVSNNTGHNSASGNTGGDVSIRTGDAAADVNISNQAGINVANVNGCCDNGDTRIKIEGNGSWSDNSVRVNRESNLTVRQDNDTNIDNNVDIRNNTGHNRANDNTWGDVTIQTGNAEADVDIKNEAGKNVLNVDGCCDGSDLDISIHGNGSGSDNAVYYNSDKDVNVRQNNDTDFDNDVDVHNNTGYNRASSDHFYPWWKDFDKKYHDGDKDRKDYDKKFVKFPKDYDRKYDDNKKRDDRDKKYRDDHDKKFYDSYKKDYDFDKYGFKKYGYDYDKDKKFYPSVKYLRYDDDRKSYKKDYDRKDNHDRYDHDKKYVYKKDYDHDNKYDHGKRHDGKKYSFASYPKFEYVSGYDRDYCSKGNDGKKYSYPWKKTHYLYRHGGGNTGGNVEIRTGNVTSVTNLHNAGSSNYLSFN